MKLHKILNSQQIFNNNTNFIDSETDFHPYSFCTGHKKWIFNDKGLLTFPARTIFSKGEYQKKPDLTKDGVLYGLEIDDKKRISFS